MNLVFFDLPSSRANLLPFTYTRPVADMRVGILTIREKWELYLGAGKSSTLTEEYLCGKFKLVREEDNLLINGCLLPSDGLVEKIRNLKVGSSLMQGKTVLAARVGSNFFKHAIYSDLDFPAGEEFTESVMMINFPWEIFSRNGEAITADFHLLTKGKKSDVLSNSVQVVGDSSNIFLEQGAKVECSILNSTTGVIYIGKDAEIMEGAIIRGPFALCEHSTVKMGAKIYGPTTIGVHSKVGGEINNSVIFGYSNKAHDGFLGNSVIGEWCNLGADTNTSNLKNNYSSVKLYNIAAASFIDTGLQFCGLMMGDHTKCAINTMFNTGTVVGVNANIFGFGFPAKFIPSFSWDGADDQVTYSLELAIDVARKVFERRNLEFTSEDAKILRHIFALTSHSRHWEKK